MSKTERAERDFEHKIRSAWATHAIIKSFDEATEDILILERKAEEWKAFRMWKDRQKIKEV